MIPSWWRVAATVCRTDLRRRVLDRSAVVTAVAAPLVLALVVGAAFGGAGRHTTRLGLVVVDPTAPVRATVAAGVRAAALPPQVSLVPLATPAALRAAVAAGTVGAGVVVPAGFGSTPSVTAALAGRPSRDPLGTVLGDVVETPGRGPGPTRVTVDTSSTGTVDAQLATGLASAVTSRLYAAVLAALVVSGHPADDPAARSTLAALALGHAAEPIAVRLVSRGVTDTDVVGYFAPTVAVVFLFIGAGLGARAIATERTGGTLARLAASPVRSGSVVAGKMAALFLTSLASILVLWAATDGLFRSSWGDAPAVAVMCLAVTVSMTALATFLASLARDPEQAFGATILVGSLLGLLGGNFFPPGALPPFLQDLSLATPNGWAVVGFGRLSLEGQGLGAVAGPAAVLAVIALVFGVASVGRIRRLVQL